MEWRQQSSVSCADAFTEARRWIEEVTGKQFGNNDFRASLENGVLLCDLINRLKPGIIKKVNRLSTPIAGLDNVSLFLKACGKLGLNVSQLFHPGDLQDLSTRATFRQDESKRRLKNVLITIYWLGRKAQLEGFYKGPQPNFKAFEGLLGLALSKVLDEGTNLSAKDGWCPQREDGAIARPGKRVENPVDLSTHHPNGEGGCGSDAEAEQDFKMDAAQPSVQRPRGTAADGGRDLNAPLASDAESWFDEELLLRALCADESAGGRAEADPVRDDLYLRRVRQGLGQASRDLVYDRFLPRYWTPEEALHVHTIYLGSRRRPWYRELHRLRSKSLSDIPLACPAREPPGGTAGREGSPDDGAAEQWEGPNRRRRPAAARDSEVQWQDDLTKWKNRRRSTKTDLRTRSQDREHVIRQMINGASTGFEQKMKREQQSPQRGAPAPRPSSPPSKSPSLKLQRPTQAPLARGFATEEPASDGGILAEERRTTCMAPPARVTDPWTRPSSGAATVENEPVTQISTLVTTLKPTETAKSTGVNHLAVSLCSLKTRPGGAALKCQTSCPEEPIGRPGGGAGPDQGSPEDPGSRFPSKGGSWCRSVSLPRGFRRSEGSSRLSSAITARPFGAMQARVSSLPKLCNVDDKPTSGEEEPLFPPFKSSLRRQTASAQLMSPVQVPADGGGRVPPDEVGDAAVPSRADGLGSRPHARSQPEQEQCNGSPKVDHGDVRVSLALKPNSRPDFGFQTRWDSTGLRVSVVQAGSPAELCRLRPDDEIVAVNGLPVARMSRSQWTETMASSLQTGSVTMDVRRYGSKDWSGGEAGLGQSRMSLNLSSGSPVLISRRTDGAGAVGQVPGSNGQTEHVGGAHAEAAGHHGAAKSGGGSESAISNLQVPSLSPSSPSRSWDLEEDRRRQEKWQEEQERLLQAQYQRDQERLEAEWQQARRDAASELHAEAENTLKMISSSGVDNQLKANGSPGTREASSPDASQLRPAGRKSLPSRAAIGRWSQESWADECVVQLSPAHRSKSMSTPLLAAAHKQSRGVAEAAEEEENKRKGQSKVEVDRQKILEEMKKRTQLLTDNSWIRQRSSSSSIAHKEPLYLGFALKRFESLDDLDSLRQASPSATAHPRPHSAAAGYCAPSRNSSSRYSTGGMAPRRSATVDCSHHGSAWVAADTSDSLRSESRSASGTESRAASAAISGLRAVVASP